MYEELSDEELMQKSANDDVQAFEYIFRRYEKPIFSYLYRMCRNRELSEDYVQDVFLRLWKNRDKYKPTGKFSSYLYQIAHNYFLNESIRKKIKVSPLPVEDADSFVMSGNSEKNPLDKLVDKEFSDFVESILAEIPEPQREVFILCRFHKMKYKEISEVLDIPVRTVESRLLAATQKLIQKFSMYSSKSVKKD
ncbi:MAG: sigma-70 family RNA polymerase sigma factor [Planctomycetes bacterium]|nr:sigma-70 family RNA polymerase sigma factor [Planctomycetota bacterium]